MCAWTSASAFHAFGVGNWVVIYVWRPLKRQIRFTYGCMAAGQNPWVRDWAAAWAERWPCLWRTAPLSRQLWHYINETYLYLYWNLEQRRRRSQWRVLWGRDSVAAKTDRRVSSEFQPRITTATYCSLRTRWTLLPARREYPVLRSNYTQ